MLIKALLLQKVDLRLYYTGTHDYETLASPGCSRSQYSVIKSRISPRIPDGLDKDGLVRSPDLEFHPKNRVSESKVFF